MLSIQKSTSIGRNSEYEVISSKSSKWLNRKGEQEWDNTPASSMIPNQRSLKTVPSQNAVSKHVQIFAIKIYHLRNLNCMDWRSFIYKWNLRSEFSVFLQILSYSYLLFRHILGKISLFAEGKVKNFHPFRSNSIRICEFFERSKRCSECGSWWKR